MVFQKLLSGKDTVKFVENIIYEKKQIQDVGVDLTVNSISILQGPGSVDFGGSEFKRGELKKYPFWKPEGEKYGWWHLGAGQYIVTYNEKINIPKGWIGVLQPLDRIIENECFHPTLVISGTKHPLNTVLSVGAAGINIKQNARISRLLLFKVE